MKDSPQFLIGGTYRDSTELPRLNILNPCTEEVLWTCPQCGPEHVFEAVERARSVQVAWARSHGSERSELLRKSAAILTERVEEIARALSLEIGRPYPQAMNEVRRGSEILHWIAGEADRIFGETITSKSGGRISITREPVGIVAGITPWNFPVGQPIQKLGPALAAGCPIILRPAEVAPMTATLLVKCFTDAGFPNGVIQMLQGAPQELSKAIFAAQNIRKIAFTGSTAVGKLLTEQAAKTLKRVSMELGGHSPVIVCKDADIAAAAAQTAMLKFANAGQVCIAPTRFYLEETIAEKFTEEFVAQAEARIVGDSQDPTSTMGPLAHAGQLQKLEELIADAVTRGARVRTGGAKPTDKQAGYYLLPTVLDQVPDTARIMSEEPFGPVAVLTTFTDLDDAITRANSTEYGLAAYAFSSNIGCCEQLSRELEAGAVGINNVEVSHHEAPFGGVKASGFGREAGRYGIQEYLSVKTTHLTWPT